ncbi:nucleotidyltransferase domain-containing protein [bacterium]|jgi:predicted nucleotidyltransferase|nr:nucleotidyltransferase domain-containing protein [bacterium]
MDTKLKQIVLNKIEEIYPQIAKEDIVVLFGSRAQGFHTKESDIDIIIFTKDYSYFERISIEKDLRRAGQDAGFEMQLDNGLLLEVKIQDLQVPKFEVMFCYDILSAQALTMENDFKTFQEEVTSQFMNNYDTLLFRTYVHFFNEFKNLEGISQRKDQLSKMNLSMKKGIIIQALLRLIVVMDKKPYTFDKYLAHIASKTKHWKKVSDFIGEINKINSFEDYTKVKVTLRDFVDSNMPQKPYVANWWKFLKQFKSL